MMITAIITKIILVYLITRITFIGMFMIFTCMTYDTFTLNKYNPLKILFNAISNYKCSDLLVSLIIIVCLLFIKKIITGNYFTVSMSREEAIIIFILGVLTRLLVRDYVTLICDKYKYNYKINDLFGFLFLNKYFKSKPVIANTIKAKPGLNGIAAGVATGSSVANRSGSGSANTGAGDSDNDNDSNNSNDSGTGNELVVNQPVVQSQAVPQAQAQAQPQTQVPSFIPQAEAEALTQARIQTFSQIELNEIETGTDTDTDTESQAPLNASEALRSLADRYNTLQSVIARYNSAHRSNIRGLSLAVDMNNQRISELSRFLANNPNHENQDEIRANIRLHTTENQLFRETLRDLYRSETELVNARNAIYLRISNGAESGRVNQASSNSNSNSSPTNSAPDSEVD